MKQHPIHTLGLTVLLLLGAVVLCNAQQQAADSLFHIPAPSVPFAQFARDGSHFLTRQLDSVRVWDVETKKQVGVPFATGSEFCCVTFLPGDTTILSLAYDIDSTCKVWDWRSGKVVRTVKLFRAVSEAAVTSDGNHILIMVSYPAKQYEMWNLNTGLYEGAVIPSENMIGILADSIGKYAIVRSFSGNSAFLLRIDIAQHRADTVPVNVHDIGRLYLSHDGQRISVARQRHSPLILDVESLDSVFSPTIDLRNYGVVSMDLGYGHGQIATLTSRDLEVPVLELWSAQSATREQVVSTDMSIKGGDIFLSPRGDYVLVYNLQTETILVPVPQGTTDVRAVAGRESKDMDAFPNPCHADLVVRFHQSESGTARVTLFSQFGSAVSSVACKNGEAGEHAVQMKTDGLSSGVYFCVVETATSRRVVPIVIEH